jgi:hypothetical protein
MDDELILSGANLSRDYFTNRQDRYHLFKARELTDYYADFHKRLRSISYKVVPAPTRPEGFEISWPDSNVCLLLKEIDFRDVQSHMFRRTSIVLMLPNFSHLLSNRVHQPSADLRPLR